MITTFPNFADYNLVLMLEKDRAERFCPVVKYKKLVLEETEIDDIHKEIAESRKRFLDPVLVRGYVEPDGETHPLTRFGIEQVRNVVLNICVAHMVESGLATQDRDTKEVAQTCAVGDRFEFSGFLYDILEIRRGKMWGCTDIPIWFQFRSERVRFDAVQFEGI